MRILVDMVHPADVHFFRHAIAHWQAAGHAVDITAREKDVTVELLRAFGLPHAVISRRGRGLAGMAIELAVRNIKLLRRVQRDGVDVLTGFSAVSAAQVAWLARRPCAAFYDTEHARTINRLTLPFCTTFNTPECYPLDHGRKHQRFRGVKEATYLHPDVFRPDAALLRAAGFDLSAPYAVLRFVSWEATHDRGQRAATSAEKVALVEALARRLRVVVSSERPLPAELRSYALDLPPQLLHQLLAHAQVVVGDGSTTVVEAALTGTPAVYVSALKLSYVTLLGRDFELVCDTDHAAEAEAVALRLVADDAKLAWAARRDRFFDWCTDVNAFVEHAVTNLVSD